jgi:hypothetical protein
MNFGFQMMKPAAVATTTGWWRISARYPFLPDRPYADYGAHIRQRQEPSRIGGPHKDSMEVRYGEIQGFVHPKAREA